MSLETKGDSSLNGTLRLLKTRSYITRSSRKEVKEAHAPLSMEDIRPSRTATPRILKRPPQNTYKERYY